MICEITTPGGYNYYLKDCLINRFELTGRKYNDFTKSFNSYRTAFPSNIIFTFCSISEEEFKNIKVKI